MQWLGFVILIGILTLLLLGVVYLGYTQKTPSRLPRPGGYGRSDFYHTEDIGNPLHNLAKLDEGSSREHRRHPQERQRPRQHMHEWEDPHAQ